MPPQIKAIYRLREDADWEFVCAFNLDEIKSIATPYSAQHWLDEIFNALGESNEGDLFQFIEPNMPSVYGPAPVPPLANAKPQLYQLYGLDADNRITHAGTRELTEPPTEAIARLLQREWEQWRQNYIALHTDDFPLKHTNPTMRLYLEVQGGQPASGQYFDVT